ncbi:MAG: LptF/LptG family permease, partial [Candidatus Latescibacterota bacterium]
MRLLDRYLLRRYLVSLSLSILGLLLVAVVVDLTESLDTFIDHQAALGQVLRYYLYRAPYWIALTLPVAALL